MKLSRYGGTGLWAYRALFLAATGAVIVVCGSRGTAEESAPTPARSPVGSDLSLFAEFANVPVGVAVSKEGRVFLAFSRAIDETEPFSVAEVVDGRPVLFPPGLAQETGPPADGRLLSVQALTVDARDRLWILDCGRVGQNDPGPGATKLVGVDLASGKVVKTIVFPPAVAGPTAFFNDLVVDLRRGKDGIAFVTDASPKGPNGIVVVDLAAGTGRRRLNDHPSTRPAPGFVARVEGRRLVYAKGPNAGKPVRVGADGIALDAGGRKLYYAPLSSRRWYRVDAEALADSRRSDADVAGTVEDLGDRGFASDGMLGSAEGTIYVTDYENGRIRRRGKDGRLAIFVSDVRLLWPDSMALAADGTLYITATQIHRGAALRDGDERVRPFRVWRVRTATHPLLLK